MKELIHVSAAAAWEDLKSRGGLELDGRDEGLEENLRVRLSPSAHSFTHALQNASPRELVSALFSALHPYAEMFRGILKFYEKAGAVQAKNHWKLEIDKVPIDLQHFRDFLAKWDPVPNDIQAHGISHDFFIRAWNVWGIDKQFNNTVIRAGMLDDDFADTNVSQWFKAYRKGKLLPFPPSLKCVNLACGFSELSAVVQVALAKILSVTERREGLKKYDYWPLSLENRTNGFSLPALFRAESDNWLGAAMACLALSKSYDDNICSEIGNGLNLALNHYSVQRFRINVDVAQLLEILSLPIWGKRHELYAVWIATEIVQATEGHECTIHHDNGRIEFAFRKTQLATVLSAIPPVTIYSERKEPLALPVGKGRSANVQPDFSLWRSLKTHEECGLVVEVKHYGRPANTSFANVLTDYANAHPKARVFLVNHGPVGDVLAKVDATVSNRCTVLGDLTPLNFEGRETLKTAVQDYVGSPVRRVHSCLLDGHGKLAIAVDVSGSMAKALVDPYFFEFLDRLSTTNDVKMVHAIDETIREVVPINEASTQLIKLANLGNHLEDPVRELLRHYECVLVLTDEDGSRDLRNVSSSDEVAGYTSLRLITVRSAH